MLDASYRIARLASDGRPGDTLLCVSVVDENDDPVVGLPVAILIEGNGTLKLGSRVDSQATLTTNDEGLADFAWFEFPVYAPRRDIEGIITATCDAPTGSITIGPCL